MKKITHVGTIVNPTKIRDSEKYYEAFFFTRKEGEVYYVLCFKSAKYCQAKYSESQLFSHKRLRRLKVPLIMIGKSFILQNKEGDMFYCCPWLFGVKIRIPKFLIASPHKTSFFIGGGGEIRTLEGFHLATFPRWWNKPLSDTSKCLWLCSLNLHHFMI